MEGSQDEHVKTVEGKIQTNDKDIEKTRGNKKGVIQSSSFP